MTPPLTYVAITLNYWGRAADAKTALARMRDAGGRTNATRFGYIIVETTDPTVEIDPINGAVLIADGTTANVITDRRTTRAKHAATRRSQP